MSTEYLSIQRYNRKFKLVEMLQLFLTLDCLRFRSSNQY